MERILPVVSSGILKSDRDTLMRHVSQMTLSLEKINGHTLNSYHVKSFMFTLRADVRDGNFKITHFSLAAPSALLSEDRQHANALLFMALLVKSIPAGVHDPFWVFSYPHDWWKGPGNILSDSNYYTYDYLLNTYTVPISIYSLWSEVVLAEMQPSGPSSKLKRTQLLDISSPERGSKRTRFPTIPSPKNARISHPKIFLTENKDLNLIALDVRIQSIKTEQNFYRDMSPSPRLTNYLEFLEDLLYVQTVYREKEERATAEASSVEHRKEYNALNPFEVPPRFSLWNLTNEPNPRVQELVREMQLRMRVPDSESRYTMTYRALTVEANRQHDWSLTLHPPDYPHANLFVAVFVMKHRLERGWVINKCIPELCKPESEGRPTYKIPSETMVSWAQRTILNYDVSGKRKTKKKKRRSKNSQIRRFIK